MMKHILLIALNILPLITAKPKYFLAETKDVNQRYSEGVTSEEVYVEGTTTKKSEKYSEESEEGYVPKKKLKKAYRNKKREKGYGKDYWTCDDCCDESGRRASGKDYWVCDSCCPTQTPRHG